MVSLVKIDDLAEDPQQHRADAAPDDEPQERRGREVLDGSIDGPLTEPPLSDAGLPTGACGTSAGESICEDAVLYRCSADGTATDSFESESAARCQIGRQAGKCAVCNSGNYKCSDTVLE